MPLCQSLLLAGLLSPATSQGSQLPTAIFADAEGDGELVNLDIRNTAEFQSAFVGTSPPTVTWFDAGQSLGTGAVLRTQLANGPTNLTVVIRESAGTTPASSTHFMLVNVDYPLMVPSVLPNLDIAISNAQDGDAILLAPGTYSGTGFVNVVIDKDILIRGAGDDSRAVVLDLMQNGRAFEIVNGASPVIEGLSMINGVAPQAGSGGAIRIEAASQPLSWQPVINRCWFEHNLAGSGGAIAVEVGRPRISNCVFVRNMVSDFGAVAVVWQNPAVIQPIEATFDSCTFSENTGPNTLIHGYSSAFLNNSIVWANSVTAHFGGSVYADTCIIEHHSPTPGFNNIITLNPRFDPVATDFRVMPSSPAVNVGLKSARPAGGVDFYGVPQDLSQGLVADADIGAVEYVDLADTTIVADMLNALEDPGDVVQLAARAVYREYTLPWVTHFAWEHTNPLAGITPGTANTATYQAPSQTSSIIVPILVDLGVEVTASVPFAGGQQKEDTTMLMPSFQRGDIDFNNTINIADAILLAQRLFPPPNPPTQPLILWDACDTQDDGVVNIADAIYLLNYLFDPLSPSFLPAPFQSEGTDPTPDLLP